jgi:hypothetical protein
VLVIIPFPGVIILVFSLLAMCNSWSNIAVE